jgi:membrane protein involved in colicin uptake
VWEKPAGFVSSGEAPLAAGWEEHADDDGAKYYHNEATGETVWERPTEAAGEAGEAAEQSEAKQTADAVAASQKRQAEEEAAAATAAKQKAAEEAAASKAKEAAAAAAAAQQKAAEAKAKAESEAEAKRKEELKLKSDTAAAAAAAAAAGASQERMEVPQHDWEAHETDDGAKKYYHNAATGETVWDAPDVFRRAEAARAHNAGLAGGASPVGAHDWEEVSDDEGAKYYHNEKTGETVCALCVCARCCG